MNCPVGFICINNIHFMYLSLILIAIMYLHSNDYLKSIRQNQIFNEVKKQEIVNVKSEPKVEPEPEPEKKEIIKEIIVPHFVEQPNFNNTVIDERLQPPLKMEPHRMPINIKTRGDGGPYQQIGTVFKISNSETTFGTPGNNDEIPSMVSVN